MSIKRPFKRTCRIFLDGKYAEGGRSKYIEHPEFAKSPGQYIRAFHLLLKDLQELFDYIEPSDQNLDCYSYRIHELLLRACVEVEANCRAILNENGFIKKNLNMNDYKKINKTHHLSSYEIKVPYWDGLKQFRKPFSSWAKGKNLSWYEAYNATKHDRYSSFKKATFNNLLDACCGVLVMLSAQFYTNEFTPGNTLLAIEGPNDGMESGIGNYFRVKFPSDWPKKSRYDFDWREVMAEKDPFQKIDYSKIV